MAQSRIAVIRPANQPVDRSRAYRILIDGQRMGSLNAGEERAYPVSPGRHTVQMRIHWRQSRTLDVEVPPGRRMRLVARPLATSPGQILFFSLLRPRRSIHLAVL